jgi:hypothetical protein
MKSLGFGRYVLGGFAVAAMLAGCDGGGASGGFYAAAGGGVGGGSTFIEPNATHVHSSKGWYRALGNGKAVFIW